MSFKTLRNSLLTAFFIVGTASLVTSSAFAENRVPEVAKDRGNSTRFDCVSLGSGRFGTYARQGSNEAMLIQWTQSGSNYFGGNYPPNRRCQMVSNRLNTAVQANGGRLSNLLLTNGYVNGETVICALGPMETRCSDRNLLFTLKPENAHRAGEILGQLLQISRYGSSAGYITETSGQVYVDLGDWEAQAFGSTSEEPRFDSVEPQPQPNVDPSGEPMF